MLADKIRLLEEAVDRAQAAEAELGRVKTVVQETLKKAQAEFDGVRTACAAEIMDVTAVHQAALRDVDKFKAEVRGFIDDIMQVGRVRQ